ncbi:hypothetical protein [Oceanisphaera sp. W20_SRM_FM3]|uniref:hypothetical protein n=1 Tax=Oceanisphaera sp. W20_SRM_FM3 TaxID=3240267 RepID=UPI003F9DB894
MIHRLMFVLLAGVLTLPDPAVAQSAKQDPEGVRIDTTSVLSRIRKFAILPGPIPLDRRYQEFTAEEKARVHAAYERIPDGDEPPFPADGLKPVYDALLKGQEHLMVAGKLRVVATVDAAGTVQSVAAFESPAAGVTRLAATILMLTKFKPASCTGKPCQMDFPLEFEFVLR